ncbi:MAG: leucine-rich repeat protein [Ruminococcus sp.]|nr:leucine-rich repeat protein [Ruminococcus sp.]
MKIIKRTLSAAVSAVMTLTSAAGSGIFISSATEQFPAGVYKDEYGLWDYYTITEGDFLFGLRTNMGVPASLADDRYKYDDIGDCPRRDDELVLLEYNGSDKDVVVPDTVDGRKVTALGANAFSEKKKIDSVTLPDQIDFIAGKAFFMSTVKKINIPEAVKIIPEDMCYGCILLEEAEGLDHVWLCSDNAFYGTDVTLPEGVLTCEDINTFSGYIDSSLPSFVSGSYEDWDFHIEWNGGNFDVIITELPMSTGAGITADGKKRTVVFPEKFGRIPVNGCRAYRNISGEEITYIFPESYDDIYMDFSTYRIAAVEFRNKDARFEGSFAGSSISEITLPSNTVYTAKMFDGCKKLKSFEAAEGTEKAELSYRFFADCGALETVTVPESCGKISIGSEAFSGDTALKTVNIPDTVCVTGIDDKAFSGCSSLESLSVPKSGVEQFSIGREAFKDCEKLSSVVFPDDCKRLIISGSAFKDCTALARAELPDVAEVHIDNYAFSGTPITSLKAESGWSIGSNAFMDCDQLSEVSINGADVGISAFMRCDALKKLTVSGAAKLNKDAFKGCTSLEDIKLIGSGYSISNSFDDCRNLMKINGKTVFDSKTGDLTPDLKPIVMESFASDDNIGFLNEYVLYHVKKTISEIIEPDMTDMEKIRTIHDWVCANAKYTDKDDSGLTDHNDASLFLLPTTVCDGYSRAFNLLAHEAGIETCVVDSIDHSWNIVKIGGLYFHIDTTWDDGDTIGRSWFLRSDREMKDAGGSHARWTLDCPSALHSFQKDTLPECSRSMGDANSDGAINTADLVLFSKYLLGGSKLTGDDQTVCDLNFDGCADTFDIVMFRRQLTSDT